MGNTHKNGPSKRKDVEDKLIATIESLPDVKATIPTTIEGIYVKNQTGKAHLVTWPHFTVTNLKHLYARLRSELYDDTPPEGEAQFTFGLLSDRKERVCGLAFTRPDIALQYRIHGEFLDRMIAAEEGGRPKGTRSKETG